MRLGDFNVSSIKTANSYLLFVFSRNERTHPSLVSRASQAREIEIFCGLQIGHPSRFVMSCLFSFVASFVAVAKTRNDPQ